MNPKSDDAAAFYDRNYDPIGQWILKPGSKQYLGSKDGKRCRFCGKDETQTTFKDAAHAISEGIGNKSLFTYWECDPCNHAFGDGIENDLGNWSKPVRTFARIRGKSGVPTLKKGSSGGWRIEFDPNAGVLNIKDYEDAPICVVDEAAKTVTFTLKRDPYTPMAVLKAFVKFGLTLLPESEIPHFVDAVEWVQEKDHAAGGVSKLPIIYGFVPGAMPPDEISAVLLRRKDDAAPLPYMFLVLAYGNEIFQVILPSAQKDVLGQRTNFEVWPYVPAAQKRLAKGPIKRGIRDMTGTQIQQDPLVLVCGFDSVKRLK